MSVFKIKSCEIVDLLMEKSKGEQIQRCGECGLQFKNLRALISHSSQAMHTKLTTYSNDLRKKQEEISSTESSLQLLKTKRLSVPMEGGDSSKKPKVGPIYYDLNALEAQIMQNNDESFDDDLNGDYDEKSDSDSYYGSASVDNEEDYAENERNNCSYATTIFNMNQQLQDTSSNKYYHPNNPEINEGPIILYYEYQVLLYEKLYGSDAFDAQNINEFKNLLTRRDTEKTSRMMEIYTFAKDCNIRYFFLKS